jgi:hypothetical protein
MTRPRYNHEFLAYFCAENNVELRKDYSGENVNSRTIIIAKCVNCDDNMVEKKFISLITSKNFGCSKCSLNIKQERMKKAILEKYGVENVSQNEEIKIQKQNTTLKHFGVKSPLQNEKIKRKARDTNIERRGVEYPGQSEEVKEKIKETISKRSPEQNAEIQKKTKETISKRTPEQNEEIQKKVKETISKRTPEQNEEIQKKTEETNIEKYGVKNPSQNEEIKQKIKETFFKNYGVEHPMQNGEFAAKISKNAYKLKFYPLPSGKIISYQGYENYALDELIKIENVNEDDIVTNKQEVPEIWYKDEYGKKHRYYVDILIESQKRCIEVKSTWTAEKKKDCIFLKQQAVIDAGYECEIWVYDGKGKKVECYKKPI